MAAILILAHGPKSIASVLYNILHHISNLKSIGEMIPNVSRSQGLSKAYILKSSMAGILFLADGPKSIASVI